MGRYRIKFRNWEKYQGKAKAHTLTSWFRVQNTLYTSELWDELDPVEFKAYVFLKCLVSQKEHKTGELEVNLKTGTRMSGLDIEAMRSMLYKIAKLDVIELESLDPVAAEGPSEDRARTAVEEKTPDHGPARNGTIRDVTLRNETKRDVTVPASPPPPADRVTAGTKVWRAYAEAYARRYGTEPAGSATTASLCKQFAQRLPEAEAPEVASFFLTHSDAYYVRTMHPLGAMLKDAVKLHTEWKTGRKVTGVKAKQEELHQNNVEAVKQFWREEKMEGTPV